MILIDYKLNLRFSNCAREVGWLKSVQRRAVLRFCVRSVHRTAYKSESCRAISKGSKSTSSSLDIVRLLHCSLFHTKSYQQQ